MKKKDPPGESDIQKIDLDTDHQSVQSENHTRLQNQVLADLEKKKSGDRAARKSGERLLAQAFAGVYTPSLLEKWMVRLCILLFVQNIAWLLGPVRTNGTQNITFFANFIGLNVRPYICFLLVTGICFLFTLRLRLKGIYREIIHGMSLANPDQRLLGQIESRIHSLKRMNDAALLPMSMLSVAFGFSFCGWEYAITGVAGVKGFAGFCAVSGLVLWLGVKRIFQLRDDLN